MEYFKHEVLNERVIRIIDFLANCCYLVIGDDKACLLDTIDGFGNVKEYAQQFTDKEIFVILTHGHLDHGGGCCWFDQVYMNHADLKLFNDSCSSDYRLSRYANRELTANIPIKDFNPIYDGEIIDIQDNQVFDLGNISIKMILVQGHTYGMMVPLIEQERMIVFGDACGVGTLLLGSVSTSVSVYKQSLLNLKNFENDYDYILRNHGTFKSPKQLLDNVIECCDKILENRTCGKSVIQFGKEMHIVEAIDEYGNRLDGQEGNIKYMPENAC